jgi:hypothetical protein
VEFALRIEGGNPLSDLLKAGYVEKSSDFDPEKSGCLGSHKLFELIMTLNQKFCPARVIIARFELRSLTCYRDGLNPMKIGKELGSAVDDKRYLRGLKQ